MLSETGVSMITVHGRMRGREDRRRDGSADLDAVATIVELLKPLGIPVVTNGNVRQP
jgi:tRNA-dihydrouridine synthase